jgi:hypothetical protein
MLPWAKANINPTGQALIISTGASCMHISSFLFRQYQHLPARPANIKRNLTSSFTLPAMSVAGMAYFIAADKKILSLARRHSFDNTPEHLKNTSFQGTGRPHPAFFRP